MMSRERIKIEFGQKSSRSVEIDDPRDVFKDYIIKFDKYSDNSEKERILEMVFQGKDNCHLEDYMEPYDLILMKVTLLNIYYSTQIPNIKINQVAKRIFNLGSEFFTLIKSNEDKDRAKLVDKIAYNTKDDDAGKIYSFATKYCSWHNPKRFPIADSYAMGLLYRLNTQGQKDKKPYCFYNKKFDQTDLKYYGKYCNIYDKFCDFVLSDLNEKEKEQYKYKAIDKFLWMYVVDRFDPENEDYIKQDKLLDDLDKEITKTREELKKKAKEKNKDFNISEDQIKMIAKKSFIQKEYLGKFKVQSTLHR